MKQIQKLSLTIILLSMITVGCGPKKSITNRSYFEGQIILTMEYSIIDPTIDIERLRTLFGTKEVVTFKKGFFRRDFYGPEGSLILSSIYDQVNNKLYMEYTGEENTYLSIPSENNFDCEYNDIGTDIILDTPCKKVEINLKPKTGVIGFDDNMTWTYYISETFLLDPEWYDEFKQTCYSDMISRYPGITMGSDMTYGGYVQKSRAVGMTFMEISMDKFRPDTSRKIVKR